MANGVTIDQPSWQQGFEDGVRRLSAKCPPDADAFSYVGFPPPVAASGRRGRSLTCVLAWEHRRRLPIGGGACGRSPHHWLNH